MPLSEASRIIERFFEEEPPSEGPQRLIWQTDLGYSYQSMVDTMAWKHLANGLIRTRERLVNKLVSGADGASSLRQTIMFIDDLLRVPNKFIREGANCRAVMARRNGESTEDVLEPRETIR